MRRIFSWVSWLLLVPILAAAVTFALNNKHFLELNLWPFGLTVELPLYLTIFGAMIFGVLLGSIVTWLGQGRVRSNLRVQAYDGEVARRELRSEREKVEALEQELKTLRVSTATAPQPAPASKTDLAVVTDTVSETTSKLAQETLPPQKQAG